MIKTIDFFTHLPLTLASNNWYGFKGHRIRFWNWHIPMSNQSLYWYQLKFVLFCVWLTVKRHQSFHLLQMYHNRCGFNGKLLLVNNKSTRKYTEFISTFSSKDIKKYLTKWMSNDFKMLQNYSKLCKIVGNNYKRNVIITYMYGAWQLL